MAERLLPVTFDKKKHLIKVQGGRLYLPVSARLVWFRQEHPGWCIETEIVEINHEKQYAIFRARISDDNGNLMATATKKEDVKGFADWLEKSETGSVGRALSLCGFSTDGDPDLDDGKHGDPAHIVDTPRPGTPSPGSSSANSGSSACAECGKALTRGQATLSQQKYQAALCTACQPKGG